MLRHLFMVTLAAIIGCVGEPARPRTPDVRGEVVSVTGARVGVRLDADSELLPELFPYGRFLYMAICSTDGVTPEGYLGEMKIDGEVSWCMWMGIDTAFVFGAFIPRDNAPRSVRIGDRASCRLP
jgi:hypothetical protein